MITLYDYLPSQNAYKVRLLLNHLQRPYVTKLVSIFEGEGQRAEFLARSPAHQHRARCPTPIQQPQQALER